MRTLENVLGSLLFNTVFFPAIQFYEFRSHKQQSDKTLTTQDRTCPCG